MTTLSQIKSRIAILESISDLKVTTYIGYDFEDIETNKGIGHDEIAIVYEGESPEIQLMDGDHQNEVEKIAIYITSINDVIQSARELARGLSGYTFQDNLLEYKTLYYIGTIPIPRVGSNEQTLRLDFECKN